MNNHHQERVLTRGLFLRRGHFIGDFLRVSRKEWQRGWFLFKPLLVAAPQNVCIGSGGVPQLGGE